MHTFSWKLGTLILTGLCAMSDHQAVAAQPPGASVAFVTLEAEAPSNHTSGELVRMRQSPRAGVYTPELEASGRAYVELKNTGDYLEFPNAPTANAMVIRHCIPDAPGGGGITATLSLYVNGQRRQAIELSSKHNWLYAEKAGEADGHGNVPTSWAHAFWDETRLFIQGGIKAGDTLRLQKDPGDQADYYRIDLIEPENVPAALSRPDNSLSVADYGAKGEDATTDTAAIKHCIADAKAQGKVVWMPPGKYLQNQYFVLDGVKVQGAGMWYTELYDTVGNAAHTWEANSGFRLIGEGPAVADLYIDSPSTTFRNAYAPKAFFGSANHWSIRNVWITHTGVGLWMAGNDGTVSGCRVRCTYADGININNGNNFEVDRVLVENNHVRGSGDDGIAVLSQRHKSDDKLTQNVTVRHNTVVATRWGGNCDLAGGSGHVIEDNLIADGMDGFTINLPPSYQMTDLTGAEIRGNLIVRAGSNLGGQQRGAIWIYPGSASISGVTIENNCIVDPLFRGIHIVGNEPQKIVFKNNTIENPGADAILIQSSAVGSGEFRGNKVTGLKPDSSALANQAKNTYQLVEEGNHWPEQGSSHP